MKKTVLTFILLLSLSGIVFADQLAYISKEQAERAAAFLKSQKEVLLFCGCCDNDPKVYLKITDVSIRHTGYRDYYEIIITGIKRNGEKITSEADLAYLHVNKSGMAVSVGKILDFECDPCVEDFPWENSGR